MNKEQSNATRVTPDSPKSKFEALVTEIKNNMSGVMSVNSENQDFLLACGDFVSHLNDMQARIREYDATEQQKIRITIEVLQHVQSKMSQLPLTSKDDIDNLLEELKKAPASPNKRRQEQLVHEGDNNKKGRRRLVFPAAPQNKDPDPIAAFSMLDGLTTSPAFDNSDMDPVAAEDFNDINDMLFALGKIHSSEKSAKTVIFSNITPGNMETFIAELKRMNKALTGEYLYNITVMKLKELEQKYNKIGAHLDHCFFEDSKNIWHKLYQDMKTLLDMQNTKILNSQTEEKINDINSSIWLKVDLISKQFKTPFEMFKTQLKALIEAKHKDVLPLLDSAINNIFLLEENLNTIENQEERFLTECDLLTYESFRHFEDNLPKPIKGPLTTEQQTNFAANTLAILAEIEHVQKNLGLLATQRSPSPK